MSVSSSLRKLIYGKLSRQKYNHFCHTFPSKTQSYFLVTCESGKVNREKVRRGMRKKGKESKRKIPS